MAAKIAQLEGGTAAMLTSSGQAANFFALFNIATCGDHIVSSSSIYGGTFNLIAVTMAKMGIQVTFVSPDCYGFLPCIQLCVCYYRMGEEGLAREYNRRAGNCKPDNEAFLYNERFFRGEL